MKNKLFLCFRPDSIETETESTGADCFDDRVLTCVTVANYRDTKISVVKSPCSTSEISKRSENAIHARKRDTRKKSFSGIVRAILFEISLRKKARNRKALQLMVGFKSSDSSKSDGFSDTNSQSIKRDSLESSSTSCSSSYSSPTAKNLSNNKCCHSQFSNFSSWNLKKQSINSPQQRSKVQNENRVTGCSSSTAGLFLILISLAVTIFCGRLCAILFTLLWLFLMSRRSICQPLSLEKMARSSPETEWSETDYGKRVIKFLT